MENLYLVRFYDECETIVDCELVKTPLRNAEAIVSIAISNADIDLSNTDIELVNILNDDDFIMAFIDSVMNNDDVDALISWMNDYDIEFFEDLTMYDLDLFVRECSELDLEILFYDLIN